MITDRYKELCVKKGSSGNCIEGMNDTHRYYYKGLCVVRNCSNENVFAFWTPKQDQERNEEFYRSMIRNMDNIANKHVTCSIKTSHDKKAKKRLLMFNSVQPS